MKEVCKELRRPYTWFFDSVTKKYIRRDGKGKINANIYGANLPNPIQLAIGRERLVLTGKLPVGTRIEADPVTHKLWEHWNANPDN